MAYDDDDENGDLAKTDRLAAILVHVGATRKGIRRLEGDVKEVKDKLEDLRSKSVDKAHCTSEHAKVDQSLRDLSQELRKKATGTAHPAVGSPAAQHMAQQMAQGNTGQMQIPKSAEEVIEEQREKTRRSLSFWIGLIATASGLLGGAVFGLMKLGRYFDRMDQVVEESEARTRKLREQIREELKEPKIIYVKVPVAPDGGTTPPANRYAPRRPKR
jgi:hypothetical protein